MAREDMRVQRTLNAIDTAFEALICEKDYDTISVTELAKRAGINKKTFYRHYPSLHDLLAAFQERYAATYIQLIQQYQLPDELDKIQQCFFEFSAQQGPAYDKITINQATYSDIRQDMVDMVMAATWSKSERVQQLSNFQKVALLQFIQQTSLTLYRQWIEEGKTTPLETVIATANILTLSGVQALLNTK